VYDLVMPPHIDKYRIQHHSGGLEFSDRIEGPELEVFEAELKESGRTIRDFNFVHDYVTITPVHEDGDCHQQPGFEGAIIITRGPIPASTQDLLPPASDA
jgi:hypothetical protein